MVQLSQELRVTKIYFDMKSPKLSIIIPIYNLGEYLDECMSSFNWQDESLEVILINDGSDNPITLSAIDAWEQKGVRVIHQANKGVSAARNAGLQEASAPYVLPIDPDNTITNRYWEVGIELLDQYPEVGVVYSAVQYMGNRKGEGQHIAFDPNRLMAMNYIDNCAVFRREIWEKANGYDEALPHLGYEDWEMWMNALKQGWAFHHVDEVLFGYRVREGSLLSTASTKDAHTENVNYLIKKHPELYQDYLSGIVSFFTDEQRNFSNTLAELQDAIHHHELQRDELTEQLHATEKHRAEIEAHRDEIHDYNQQLTKQLGHAMNSNVNLQSRINAIESSKLFKLQRELSVLKSRLRSNSSMGKSKNAFRKVIVLFSKKSWNVLRRLLAKVFKHVYLALEETKVVIVEAGKAFQSGHADPYMNWITQRKPNEDRLLEQRKNASRFMHAPLFSIVMPVYNPPIHLFKAAIDSVLQQSYEEWELILSDDCSTDIEVRKTIEAYAKRDGRIVPIYRETNGHISAASNSGLAEAKGDFVVLMDQDDLLALDALYKVALRIEEKPETDLIYTDEDKIDEEDFHSVPHFKPDWSPESLLSRNYLGHLTVFRTSLMREIGGWRLGFEGSQDYDLVLRFTEQTDRIEHIPEVLYHWRIHAASAADSEEAKPYAYMAAQKALMEALQRRGIPGKVDFLDAFRGYKIQPDVLDPNARVSIIIPTKDKASILDTCLASIFEHTSYANYEVVVVDNNSEEKSTFELFQKWTKAQPNFKVERVTEKFNFSLLMNKGRAASSGEYLILLNNDTEVISSNWIEGMLAQCQRPEIGVAGVKLLYPNDTIQHAGVIIGLGGAAGHVLVGEHRDGPGYFNYVNLLNNYAALTAACIMVKTSVFDEVSGFNESFAVEYNDVDFCLRVLDQGYRNVYIPHVELYHHESISRGHPHLTKESMIRHKAEIAKLRDRWEGYIENDPYYNPNLSLGAHDFRMKY